MSDESGSDRVYFADFRSLPVHSVGWSVVNDSICFGLHGPLEPCVWTTGVKGLNRIIDDRQERGTTALARAEAAESVLIDAYEIVKAVADAYVTHGERYWRLRDRMKAVIDGRSQADAR